MDKPIENLRLSELLILQMSAKNKQESKLDPKLIENEIENVQKMNKNAQFSDKIEQKSEPMENNTEKESKKLEKEKQENIKRKNSEYFEAEPIKNNNDWVKYQIFKFYQINYRFLLGWRRKIKLFDKIRRIGKSKEKKL